MLRRRGTVEAMDSPLVVTADPTLREELLRLAAAAGVVLDVVTDADSGLRRWASAPLVLVGGDLAEPLAALRPRRREGVQLLVWGRAPDAAFRAAIGLGAEGVVDLPRSEGWLVELLTDVGETPPAGGVVVGVIGGSGGAGATTLACALGQVAARAGDAVVLDCDALGPGVDRVLGLDTADGFRWDALCQTTGRLSARALREALPRRERVGVLTWHPGSTASLQAFAVREALSAARRGHDTVVVDLPRLVDPLVEEVVAQCDLLLVVGVPSVAGLASSARLLARLRQPPGARMVLRGTGIDERDVVRALRTPVLVTVAHQRGLEESVDLGLGPVRSHRSPLGRACTKILAAARAGDVREVAA